MTPQPPHPPTQKSVIPTEGGAFAAAVEGPPYFAFAVAADEWLDGANVSTLANLPVGSIRAVGYSTRQNYHLCDEPAWMVPASLHRASLFPLDLRVTE